MAEDVQKLLLQVDATTTLLRQELAKARGDVDRFADRTERRTKDVANSIEGMNKAAGAAATKLAGMATAFFSVSQAASFIVRANADMQRLSAMMEVATGSTQRASAAMGDLQRFAADTPFTLTQVTEAYIKLKNLGLDPSIETMRSFGNTSAAMGKDIMQFIEAVADAATGEFERLKEFGIKASKEGDNVKFTFQGVTTTVQNSAEAITAYLRALGSESGVFAGSMAKQMDTINGKISNLEDAAASFATTLGALGFNSLFMNQLDKATKGLVYLERVAKGLSNIRATEGLGAMMTTSFDEAASSATPQGMRGRLIQQSNAARADLISAERRQAGMFPMAGTAFANIQRRDQAAAQRLAQFEASMKTEVPEQGSGKPKPKPTPAPAKTKKKAKSTQYDTFIDPEMRSGWALEMQKDGNASFEVQNQALQSMADTLKELQTQDFSIDVIGYEQLRFAEDYTRALTEGLAASIVYGEKLGDVLKNIGRSILATGLNALIESAIGQTSRNLFGGLFGGATAFGGFREKGGPVSPGKAYVVGEKRPELFVPSTAGTIMPNVPNGGNGGGGGTTRVVVEPSPLFAVTVIEGATQIARSEVANGIAKANRPRMTAAMGV
jgi:hypothetical protein